MSEHIVTTVTVETFARISGLGKTKIFELLKDGEIQSFRCGRRRLVVIESWIDYSKREIERECRSRSQSAAAVRHHSAN